jgi:hypothetical protein
MSAPPRLDLPTGGWVDFIDFDDVSGKDYRRLRAVTNIPNGERVNDLTSVLAEVMVREWDIPRRPGLNIPRRDPKAIEKLNYRQLYALEKAMLPMYDRIIAGEGDDEVDEETGETPLPEPAAG